MMNSTSVLNSEEQLARFTNQFLSVFSLLIANTMIFQKLRSLFAFVIQEYAEFLHEFMCAVKQNYGEKVLVQVSHRILS
jgi:hypothetical protein